MSGLYDFGDLAVGRRVNVEGELQPDGSLLANLISLKDDGEADELAGTITRVDAAAPLVEVLGLQLDMDGAVEIKDVDKRPLPLAALHPGMRVKVKGRAAPGGRFVPQKIKLRLPTPDAMDELESAITVIDAEARCLTVMGFRVRCGPDLEIEA